ncbi:MAG: acetyl-CoA carboxylase, carboxyltransferase subunit beta [Verrucomicrobiota bacterium]
MGIFKKPSLKVFGGKKKEMPEGLWQKCPECGGMIHQLELVENLQVCSKCDHHFTLTGVDRIHSVIDPDTFEEMDTNLRSKDSLGFLDYGSKIKKNQDKTGLSDAIVTGRATIEGKPILIGAMDFRFLGASMGSVVGEKITRAIETATAEKKPVILFSASGGARMHEGILSLMQMAKTSAALARHHAAGLSFISVLTNPTYGGVTASFSTLGDVILAEPQTMVGFAGPRVIKETTHQDLPDGFQTAEFLLEHGLIDRIVDRQEMRGELSGLIDYFQNAIVAA